METARSNSISAPPEASAESIELIQAGLTETQVGALACLLGHSKTGLELPVVGHLHDKEAKPARVKTLADCAVLVRTSKALNDKVLAALKEVANQSLRA